MTPDQERRADAAEEARTGGDSDGARSGRSGGGSADGPTRRRLLSYGLAGAAGGTLGCAAVAGCADERTGRSPASSPAGPTPRPAVSADPSAGGLAAEVVHGPRDRPLVALTFHGQGDPALATALLAEAERAGARVTVLAVGSWLDQHRQMARRIIDGGHELGNHTQRHLDINSMSEAGAFMEIRECADLLRRLTGSAGHWFRPSRTPHATSAVQRAARRAGYRHCLSYDVDSLDYTDPGAAAVGRTVLRAVRPGSVVSLHLGHPGTVAAMPAILDGLRRRGLRAVTATALLTA